MLPHSGGTGIVMTRKLFYEDSFINNFSASVLECKKVGENYHIRLDATAFFPEGGGQSGDSGFIGEVEVFDTHESGGEIWHYAKAPLEEGKEYGCKIDFEKRFRRMQCHSGEHIVSGLLHSLFGANNVGFHLGDSDVTIDTDIELTKEQLLEVEKLANEAIAKDFEVKVFFPNEETAKNTEYRSKLDITENLRLVEYPGYDICACCAPHVKKTGQIGVIKLLDFAHYKGGMRIHLLSGMMALEDYHNRYTAVQKISNLLSARQSEVYEAVERLKKENEASLLKIGALKKELARSMAENASPTDKNLLFFSGLLDGAAARELANLATDKCGGICAVFTGNDGAYNFCMASKTVDLKAKAKEIGEALGGKCGGSSEMISGRCEACREKITAYFS
jgi:alanyl-tRNA synthetase